MQHAQYNAAYLSNVTQAANAYYNMINDACEALLGQLDYAVDYYTAGAAYMDVLDFVTPQYSSGTVCKEDELTEPVMDKVNEDIRARMQSITGLEGGAGEGPILSFEGAEEALAKHIGWTA